MGMLRKLPLLCNWAFKNLRDKIDELLETFQKSFVGEEEVPYTFLAGTTVLREVQGENLCGW